MTDPTKKPARELRKFGITMAVPLALIGALLWWRGRPSWGYLVALAGLFLVVGLFVPRALLPVEWAWMKLAHYLSLIMSYVVLTITFYLVITPIGLAMRLAGKDPMERKFEPERKSYWIPVQPDGPHTRPDRPF